MTISSMNNDWWQLVYECPLTSQAIHWRSQIICASNMNATDCENTSLTKSCKTHFWQNEKKTYKVSTAALLAHSFSVRVCVGSVYFALPPNFCCIFEFIFFKTAVIKVDETILLLLVFVLLSVPNDNISFKAQSIRNQFTICSIYSIYPSRIHHHFSFEIILSNIWKVYRKYFRSAGVIHSIRSFIRDPIFILHK